MTTTIWKRLDREHLEQMIDMLSDMRQRAAQRAMDEEVTGMLLRGLGTAPLSSALLANAAACREVETQADLLRAEVRAYTRSVS